MIQDLVSMITTDILVHFFSKFETRILSMNVSMKVIVAQVVVQRMVQTAVVKQPADNSCLYHSLNYNLSYDDLHRDVHGENSGFKLRKEVNEGIRGNHTYLILDHSCLWNFDKILLQKSQV